MAGKKKKKNRKRWDYTSRNTVRTREIEMKDKMNKGNWISWILQDWTIELSGCKCLLFFEKREE